jgi:hypothetical protein
MSNAMEIETEVEHRVRVIMIVIPTGHAAEMEIRRLDPYTELRKCLGPQHSRVILLRSA